jgi:hypothetical protein
MPEAGVLAGDALFMVIGRKFGDEVLDLVPQPELPPFGQDHDRGRRGHRLGQGGQVEDHVRRHGLGIRDRLGQPVGLPENDPALAGDEQDGAREIPAVEGLTDDPVEQGQVFGGHARVLGPGRGEFPVPVRGQSQYPGQHRRREDP